MAWKDLSSEVSELFGFLSALDRKDTDREHGTTPVRRGLHIRLTERTTRIADDRPYLDPTQRHARSLAADRARYERKGGWAGLPESTKEANRRAAREHGLKAYRALAPEERKERNRKVKEGRDPAKYAAEQARYAKAHRQELQEKQNARRRAKRLDRQRADDAHVVDGAGQVT